MQKRITRFLRRSAPLRGRAVSRNRQACAADIGPHVVDRTRYSSPDHPCEGVAAIAGLRTRLLAEHLGVDAEQIEAQFRASNSLIDTIEALRGDGKTLELLDLEKPGAFEKLIAENELLDPEHANGFLEPLAERGLKKRWREGRRRIAARLKRRHSR